MSTPREAIVLDITRPPATPSRWAWPGAGKVYRGGNPYQARRETIRFLKERVERTRAMLAVDFEDTEGRPWQYVFSAARQRDGTWKVEGGAGGGGGVSRSAGPWANFGGWGGPKHLCLGGRVHGEGVRRVRLIDARGLVVEDSVDDGIALLLCSEPVKVPCRLELLDAGGRVLTTQSWPPDS